MMHNFRDMIVWQKSMELVNVIYEITKNFPHTEIFALTSQIQRSAVSIPANIAEGAGRMTNKEFVHFMAIANGSAYELETELIIAKYQQYIDYEIYENLINALFEIQKMLYSLIKKYE